MTWSSPMTEARMRSRRVTTRGYAGERSCLSPAAQGLAEHRERRLRVVGDDRVDTGCEQRADVAGHVPEGVGSLAVAEVAGQEAVLGPDGPHVHGQPEPVGVADDGRGPVDRSPDVTR